MANITVLLEALGAALLYPDQHNQKSWISGPEAGEGFKVRADNDQTPPCGTALCLAGWIAFQQAPKGAKLRASIYGDDPVVKLPGGAEPTVEKYATEKAHLTSDQADALFSGHLSPAELMRMVALLTDEPDADSAGLFAAAEA